MCEHAIVDSEDYNDRVRLLCDSLAVAGFTCQEKAIFWTKLRLTIGIISFTTIIPTRDIVIHMADFCLRDPRAAALDDELDRVLRIVRRGGTLRTCRQLWQFLENDK